ncbi:MAG TPA: hypothetical protein VI320_06070 [Terracidiphilus sp.]
MGRFVCKIEHSLLAIVVVCVASQSRAQNANPNVALIHEYGRIEWHGNTAELIAGGSEPLRFAAMTLSTCLGVAVNYEAPQYRYLGDLLDVTTPQWAASHPDFHVYAAKSGKVDVSFEVTSAGSPTHLSELIQNTAKQANEQQPYAYQILESGSDKRPTYSFVPTAGHNEEGVLEQIPAFLDQKITFAPQTALILDFTNMLTPLCVHRSREAEERKGAIKIGVAGSPSSAISPRN